MPPKRLEARLHILYVEQAEDQRLAKKRVAGLHLGVPKLGPTRCEACAGVVDIWRGRLDNVQTSLRMCCAEGAIFRPAVAEFVLFSPRAALRYDVPRLGQWMAAQGTKRPTEALVVGSALRVVAGELGSKECGIEHAAFEPSDDGTGEGMWRWLQEWADTLRSGAVASRGRVVALTLDKSAPILVPSPTAGTIASHCGQASDITDIIVVIGGPAGVPASWQRRIDDTLGEPLVKVALRGSLQHSYAALLDLLLLHERNELVPLLLDRLVLTPAQLTQWMQAEQESLRLWLGRIGCVRRRSCPSLYLGSPSISPSVHPSAQAAEPTVEAILARHRTLMQELGAPSQGAAGKKARRRAAAMSAPQSDSSFPDLPGRYSRGGSRASGKSIGGTGHLLSVSSSPPAQSPNLRKERKRKRGHVK